MSFLMKRLIVSSQGLMLSRTSSRFRYFSTQNNVNNSKTEPSPAPAVNSEGSNTEAKAPETPAPPARKFFHPDGREMTKEEVEKMALEEAQKAAQSERIWQIGAADKYWGATSPAFGILAGLTVTLILVNEFMEPKEQPDFIAQEKARREEADAQRKKREERLAQLAAASNASAGDADEKWKAALAAASK